jgi:hypothetical protein
VVLVLVTEGTTEVGMAEVAATEEMMLETEELAGPAMMLETEEATGLTTETTDETAAEAELATGATTLTA